MTSRGSVAKNHPQGVYTTQNETRAELEMLMCFILWGVTQTYGKNETPESSDHSSIETIDRRMRNYWRLHKCLNSYDIICLGPFHNVLTLPWFPCFQRAALKRKSSITEWCLMGTGSRMTRRGGGVVYPQSDVSHNDISQSQASVSWLKQNGRIACFAR